MPPASSPASGPPAGPATAAAPLPTGPSVRAGRHRVPDTLKSGLRGEALPYKVSRGGTTAPVRRRLPKESSLADIVGLLVGQAVPIRATPDGRLAGWWRLGPSEGPLPADTRVDTLDPEQNLLFHFVESRTLLLDVELGTTRLRMPVATAVPVATLVDAFAALLDLPPGDWVLAIDGAALEPTHILEDRGVHAGSVLQLRKP